MRLSSWIYRIVRWGLGGIFIYSGATKLLAPQIFAVLIDAYGIVPEDLLMPVAVILPTLEVLAGVGLLFDIRGSLAVIAGLLMLFFSLSWDTVSGWGWMWTAAASALRSRKPRRSMDSGWPYTGIWPCWRQSFFYMDGVDTAVRSPGKQFR